MTTLRTGWIMAITDRLARWLRPHAILIHSPAPGRRDHGAESGQVLVLFALMVAVIMGAVALVLDQGLLRKANQDLWNSLDAGALAGVALLPDQGAAAAGVARQYVHENYPGTLDDGQLRVSFRCLIGSSRGAPRLTDVPMACDPGAGATWTCDSTVCTAPCEAGTSDRCNVIVVESPAHVDYSFGRAVGVTGGDVETKLTAACKGWCGQPPNVPVDVVVVLDRSSSMSGVDTANARNAADAVRRAYDPDLHHIGLGLLGPSKSTATCLTAADTVIGTAATSSLRRWVPVGLSGIGATSNSESYLSATSKLAKGIACFDNSSTGTDIADPVKLATYELQTYGRTNARKAILLLSDGKPNKSTSGTTRYCEEAYDAAAAAKAAGIEFFSVGFGLDGSGNERCDDPSGPWYGKDNRTLLAAMASDSVDGGCPGTSNSDGDHFYCVPKTAGASTDLSTIFQQAINSVVGKSRLIKLP